MRQGAGHPRRQSKRCDAIAVGFHPLVLIRLGEVRFRAGMIIVERYASGRDLSAKFEGWCRCLEAFLASPHDCDVFA